MNVISLIALKGGVGKTTCTVSLGSSLAYTFNKKVLLIDANLSAPSLGFYFNIIKPQHTLQDVLQKKIRVEQAIHEHDKNLHLIPAALSQNKITHIQTLKQTIMRIKKYYDIILIDSAPSLGQELLATLTASNTAYIVTTPDVPSLSTTLRLMQFMKKKQTLIGGIIINKTKKAQYELTKQEIEKTTDALITTTIPYDTRIEIAMHYAKPIHALYPQSPAAIAYNCLAAHILDEEYTDPRIFSRIKHALGLT